MGLLIEDNWSVKIIPKKCTASIFNNCYSSQIIYVHSRFFVRSDSVSFIAVGSCALCSVFFGFACLIVLCHVSNVVCVPALSILWPPPPFRFPLLFICTILSNINKHKTHTYTDILASFSLSTFYYLFSKTSTHRQKKVLLQGSRNCIWSWRS